MKNKKIVLAKLIIQINTLDLLLFEFLCLDFLNPAALSIYLYLLSLSSKGVSISIGE